MGRAAYMCTHTAQHYTHIIYILINYVYILYNACVLRSLNRPLLCRNSSSTTIHPIAVLCFRDSKKGLINSDIINFKRSTRFYCIILWSGVSVVCKYYHQTPYDVHYYYLHHVTLYTYTVRRYKHN